MINKTRFMFLQLQYSGPCGTGRISSAMQNLYVYFQGNFSVVLATFIFL